MLPLVGRLQMPLNIDSRGLYGKRGALKIPSFRRFLIPLITDSGGLYGLRRDLISPLEDYKYPQALTLEDSMGCAMNLGPSALEIYKCYEILLGTAQICYRYNIQHI